MDNLTPRLKELVTRLSGPAPDGPAPSLSPDGAVMEGTGGPDPTVLENAYRQTLQRWFELTGQGPAADREEVARTYQDILRLIDEVGEPRATTLRRQWAREWWQRTGVCPYCGEQGLYHDPGQGGEATDG